MNKMIAFSSFYILGVIAFFTHTIVFVAALLLFFLILLLYKNIFSGKACIVFYLAFVLALLNCHFRIKDYDDLSKFIPSNATVTGVVESIPTTNSPDRTKFYFKADSIKSQKDGESIVVQDNAIDARTMVTIYDKSQEFSKIKVADRLELRGKLRKPMSAKNPSQFDYSNYLKNHSTYSTFYVKSGDWKILSGATSYGGKFFQHLNDKRLEILDIHKKFIRSPNLEVLGGIVFGDDAINPPDRIKASFINSGLLHILAASGMNVSIIFGIWFFIGSRLRLNYRAVILIGAILVAFYTLMTGMGPSVLRAAVMIEFVLFGKLINRDSDSIALVFFVAFLMLLFSPSMINDVGFQLSFVVTFALMFYCPCVLEKIKNKFLEFCAGTVMIPIVAQLFAAPIQMFYFNNFATYSVIANLLITPFIMVISFLGFLSSILAMIPFDVFTLNVCKFFDVILNPFVTVLVKISDYFSDLPYSLLTTFHPTFGQIFLYYLILLLIGFYIRNIFKNKPFVIAICILCVLFTLSLFKIENKNCEIIFFDVGNADSFLIKTPNRKYIMIDTAHGKYEGAKTSFSQADSIMGKYLKDNGIKALDLMILTHFDSDHSGGAVDIMKNVRVKKLVLNNLKDDSKTTKQLLKFVKDNNINVQSAKNNDIAFEESGLKLMTFVADFKGNESNDNDNSIVSLLSYKDFDILFMGDGGIKTYEKIKRYITLKDIEILKSGHHGAKNTVSNNMLKNTNVDVAVISTGYNNYGHPAKETLAKLVDNDVKIYRTDTNNAIKIASDGVSYSIYKFDTQKRKFVETKKKTLCLDYN